MSVLALLWAVSARTAAENQLPVPCPPNAATVAENAAAAAPSPTFVDSRTVVLGFEAPPSGSVETIHVWMRRGGLAEWTEVAVKRRTPHSVEFQAPGDGPYDFYLVLENGAGRSGEPPLAGTAPHAVIVVDTAPPTVQLHRAERGPHATLCVQATIIEENLDAAGLRVFYRTNAADGWHDGGAAHQAHKAIECPLPADLPAAFDVGLLVTDRAGNRGYHELCDVGGRPADTPATALVAGSVGPPGPAPAAPTSQPNETTAEPAGPPSAAGLDPAARKLRDMAKHYLEQGRYSLAAARLQQAMGIAPADAGLQVELGNVYLRASRYEEARRQFESASAQAVNNEGALEGLALVAVSQKRYADAREQLKRLLELQPGSARYWLRSGDVHFKLGDRAAASQAWRHVLDLQPADADARNKASERLKTLTEERGN